MVRRTPPVRQSRIYVRDERYLKDIKDPDVRRLFEPEKTKGILQQSPVKAFRKELSEAISLQPYLADWNSSARSPELIFSDGTDLSHGRLQNFRLPDGTALEEDTVRHQAHDSYLPRPEAEEAVRAYFLGDQVKPMILLAEAGAGKTSLIAHMVSIFPEEKPFYRFAGTSFDSMSTRRLLGSLLDEIAQRGYLQEKDLSLQPDLTMHMFPFLLQQAAGAAGRIDIIIDALDQLEDPELCRVWIPKILPKNARLLITVKERDDGSLPAYLPAAADPGDGLSPCRRSHGGAGHRGTRQQAQPLADARRREALTCPQQKAAIKERNDHDRCERKNDPRNGLRAVRRRQAESHADGAGKAA